MFVGVARFNVLHQRQFCFDIQRGLLHFLRCGYVGENTEAGEQCE
jgi:hypothetical protein